MTVTETDRDASGDDNDAGSSGKPSDDLLKVTGLVKHFGDKPSSGRTLALRHGVFEKLSC